MSNFPVKYIERRIAVISIPQVNNLGSSKQFYSGRNLGVPCKYLVRYLLTLPRHYIVGTGSSTTPGSLHWFAAVVRNSRTTFGLQR